MEDTRILLTPPSRSRLALTGLLIAAAGALAGTAYTRDAATVVTYACEDGDRFEIELRPGHVRLRHGTGVFVLGADDQTSHPRFSDGHRVLHLSGNAATLEPSGPRPRGGCLSEG
jgi:hypothetical protein